ncbi:hypothetical protein ACQEVZ_25505 [Dactylosporangium sp. CA-152071]|uniref:hypothetical protein n=1 Tax=Dactylosporangium sp. CA-152071 TaxID=3239933 RepID=UPI003D8E7121
MQAGDWSPVVRDVFADRGLPVTPRLRDVAAQLALPGAVLAGPSAARWHGWEVPSTETFVAFPGRRPRLRHVHVVPVDLPATDICTVDQQQVTTPSRTVFDCARLLPDGAASALLATALQECWTTMPDLATRIRDATGRHGTPRLVRLVRMVALGNRTAAQKLAGKLLQRAGIWGWSPHEPISDRWGLIGLGDLVFPEAKLVIELGIDELEPAPLRERHTRLAAAGWTVVSYSWTDLTTRPSDLVAELRQHLDRLTPVRW